MAALSSPAIASRIKYNKANPLLNNGPRACKVLYPDNAQALRDRDQIDKVLRCAAEKKVRGNMKLAPAENPSALIAALVARSWCKIYETSAGDSNVFVKPSTSHPHRSHDRRDESSTVALAQDVTDNTGPTTTPLLHQDTKDPSPRRKKFQLRVMRFQHYLFIADKSCHRIHDHTDFYPFKQPIHPSLTAHHPSAANQQQMKNSSRSKTIPSKPSSNRIQHAAPTMTSQGYTQARTGKMYNTSGGNQPATLVNNSEQEKIAFGHVLKLNSEFDLENP